MRTISQEPQMEPKALDVQGIIPRTKIYPTRISKKAKAAPDLNEAKIMHLKSAIQGGTYKIDAEKIAEKILKEHILLFFP